MKFAGPFDIFYYFLFIAARTCDASHSGSISIWMIEHWTLSRVENSYFFLHRFFCQFDPCWAEFSFLFVLFFFFITISAKRACNVPIVPACSSGTIDEANFHFHDNPSLESFILTFCWHHGNLCIQIEIGIYFPIRFQRLWRTAYISFITEQIEHWTRDPNTCHHSVLRMHKIPFNIYWIFLRRWDAACGVASKPFRQIKNNNNNNLSKFLGAHRQTDRHTQRHSWHRKNPWQKLSPRISCFSLPPILRKSENKFDPSDK